MKTIEEKLQICRECKNRIEYHSGLTCSVTSSKPEFEDECANYTPDYKEIEKNRRRAEKEDANKTKVRGWLAFFLWVGVCGGVLLTIGKAILESDNILYSLVGLAPQFPVFIIAVMTIIAFYKRKDNAVALAYTYIGMNILCSVYLIIILGIAEDTISASEMTDHFITIFQTFAWGICWFSFLRLSDRVKNVIPEETRKWGIPEKILLLLYILLLAVSVWLTDLGAKQTSSTTTQSIDSMIEQLNAESMPNDLGNGVILKSVAKENDVIAYSYVLNELEKKEYDAKNLDTYFLQSKYQILSLLLYNPERDQFVVTALNENYKLMFSYKDKNGESLGCVWITPEDYKRVIDNNGRNIVEKNVLMELLDEYNKIIPCEYFGGTELMSVELNYEENNVVYNVRLPELSADEMSSVTQSYLENYVLENWNALEDSMITLAKINKMDFVFLFKAHYSGKDYAEVRITPEKYLQQ